MSARDEVLGRVRAALAGTPGPEPVRREYRVTGPLPPGHEGLVERLRDYRALVRRGHPGDAVPGLLAAAVAERGARRLVVPPGLPPDWVAALGDQVLVDDGRLGPAELDTVDGVVTGCAVAVAETGTIVLDASAGQGRRLLTLVPDYHLCVVLPEAVVATVPEALARLDPRRPLTWISGPSATSDIELDRVEGVHGPRTLEVVLAPTR
ncbi:MAG TPA: LUD domain-containing protein [Jiangellales bacterium]|nr:LUD domain-containing protein [Jiangellales bacterium]